MGELEEKLQILDNEHTGHPRIKCRELDELNPHDMKRFFLFKRIREELKVYDNLVMREQKSAAMPRPTRRDYISYWNFLDNNGCLMETEGRFIYHPHDMINISTMDRHWLGTLLEICILRLPDWAQVVSIDWRVPLLLLETDVPSVL